MSSIKDRYSFWEDRTVDGFVYRFSEYEILRHPVCGPAHFKVHQEFGCPLACAKAWRALCDKSEDEKTHAAL